MSRTWKDGRADRASKQPPSGQRTLRAESGQRWSRGARIRRVRSVRQERMA